MFGGPKRTKDHVMVIKGDEMGRPPSAHGDPRPSDPPSDARPNPSGADIVSHRGAPSENRGAIVSGTRADMSQAQVKRLAWTALVLAALCVFVAEDFWGTIVFASWTVTTFYGVYARLTSKLRPAWAGLLLTVAIIVVILAPLVIIAVILTSRTIELVTQAIQLWHSGGPLQAVAALFSDDGARPKLVDLYREAAREVPGLLASVGRVFSEISQIVVKTFLFIVFVYGLFVNGRAAKAWILAKSPLGKSATAKLMQIYCETGRGILVGFFLVLVLHGVVAAVGYAVIGIGRPFELGALTAVAGLVPGIGTGLVWVPLAIVLAVTGHVGQGIGVVVVGILVGTIDNFLRPWLSRLGRVPLPTLALFVAFFSGITVFGPSGVLLGPLLFAWGKGALDLYADRRAQAPPQGRAPKVS
jgi:predicted PurR-regulated permease PerM